MIENCLITRGEEEFLFMNDACFYDLSSSIEKSIVEMHECYCDKREICIDDVISEVRKYLFRALCLVDEVPTKNVRHVISVLGDEPKGGMFKIDICPISGKEITLVETESGFDKTEKPP
jgi:hypothetical protein